MNNHFEEPITLEALREKYEEAEFLDVDGADAERLGRFKAFIDGIKETDTIKRVNHSEGGRFWVGYKTVTTEGKTVEKYIHETGLLPSPRHNDIVCHCGHFANGESKDCIFFHQGNGADFGRPDGTRGTAQWIVACKECFDAAGGDVTKIQIRGDTRLLDDGSGFFKPERL